MEEQKRILVVGSLNMDQVVQVPRLPVLGETLLGAGSLKLVPGGKGANQAVAMARLGGAVTMAGRVGRDPFGQQLLVALQTAGVSTELVAIDAEEASGTAFIFLVEQDNAIIVAAGANGRLGRDAGHLARIEEALAQASAVVLQLEIPLATVEHLIKAARAAAVPVVLNAAPAQPLSPDLLRQVELLIVNEHEAQALVTALGTPPDSSVTTAASREPEAKDVLTQARALALRLHEHGVATVAVTLGAAGALLVTRESQSGAGPLILHEPAPRVQVTDTTAAGDCFVGALTVGLLEGQPPAQALRFAVYASALKVTRFGAQSGLPSRAEVVAFLAGDSSPA
ncbi:MAG: ribokinase [Thermogemmatispora sp.]|uniref:ribokinase n=1 Tax=Thermogemmatispora sp. TaxID=1968838 RepID=UPI0026138576|nr:ribokinase [Thermogemmatispora sp.]MBX5455978.1 ribokinase [Thermogemmatispora sp.]